MLNKKVFSTGLIRGFLLWVLAVIAGCASLSRLETPNVDEIVVRVLNNEQRLTEIWPGFWSPGKSFLVFDPSGDALVRTLAEPPSPFRPLQPGDALASPELLDARVYFHAGVPEGLTESFRIAYPLGEEKLIAVPRRSTMADSLKFLFHESFHGYQREHFHEDEDTDRVLFVPPEAFSPESLVLARLEQQVLGAALAAESIGEITAHAVDYLALRQKRLESLPVQAETVERMWARSEGMATLAEARGLSLLFVGDDTAVARFLRVNYLVEEFSDYSRSPAESMLRWRQYGVGAAIGWILDRLREDAWHQRIELGESPDVLLAEALDYDAASADVRVTELYARYGFDDQLPEASKRLESMRMPSAERVRAAERRVMIQFSDACVGRTGGGFIGDPVRVAKDAILIDAHRYERDDECMKLDVRKNWVLEEAGTNDLMRLQIPVRRWPRSLQIEPDGNSIVTDKLRIDTRRFDLELRSRARVTRTPELLLIEFLDQNGQ